MTKKIQFCFDEKTMAILVAMKKRSGISTLAGLIRELLIAGDIILRHLDQGFELQLVRGEKTVVLITPLFLPGAKTEEKK